MAGSLLALIALAWVGLPPLIKSQAQSRGSAALGRSLTIGEVTIEPFKLALTVSDLAIGPAGPAGPSGAASAAQPLLRIARVRVVAEMASVWQRAPVIGAVEIDTPQVRLTRTAEGHYDIDDLIERFGQPKSKPADDEPARFALNNLQLKNGSLHFDDRPVGRVHRLEALAVDLPFLSNLPSQVAIKVQPRVQVTLNGTAFDTGAVATPFAQAREADLHLKLAPLDVSPYLGYLPAALPVRVLRAQLQSDLKLHFLQPPASSADTTPQVQLTGWITARELALADRANAPLVDWRELRIDLRDVQPLKRQVQLAALKLDGANLVAVREANGSTNWQRLAAGPATPASAADGGVNPTTAAKTREAVKASPAASAAASGTGAPAATAAASAWTFALDDLQLTGAQVQLTDNASRPRAQWLIDGVGLQLQNLRWPAVSPSPVQASATLRKGAAAPGPSPTLGTLTVKGQASPQQAALEAQLDGLLLEPLTPYLATVLTPNVSGKLSAQATLDWSGAADAPRLKVNLLKATLDGLRLTEGAGRSATNLMSLQQLGVAAVQADLLARRVSVGSIKLARPTLQLARDGAGAWNVQRWAAPAPTPASVSTAKAISPATANPVPAFPAKPEVVWAVLLKDLSMDGGHVMVSDAAPTGTTAAPSTGAIATPPGGTSPAATPRPPVRFDLAHLRVRLNDLAWPAAKGQPIRLQLAAQVGPPAAAGAKPAGAAIDWNGRMGLAPFQAAGALGIDRLDVHLFEPYFGASMPVHLQQAQASAKAQLALQMAPEGLRADLNADLRVADLFVRTRPVRVAGQPAPDADTGDELLSWQSLLLDGVVVALAPGAAPKIDIRAIALSDFYSRLTITEQGRFNLSDVAAAPPGAASTATSSAAATSVAAAAAGSVPAAATTAVPTAASATAPVLNIGPTRLVNGRIDFTDRFVRPSYSTRLTELNGQIGAFRSGTRDMAAIELRGRAEGTALLDIVGQLNPTANPLALDIRAKATDLELAPLSPYAGKYAGSHGVGSRVGRKMGT